MQKKIANQIKKQKKIAKQNCVTNKKKLQFVYSYVQFGDFIYIALKYAIYWELCNKKNKSAWRMLWKYTKSTG